MSKTSVLIPVKWPDITARDGDGAGASKSRLTGEGKGGRD